MGQRWAIEEGGGAWVAWWEERGGWGGTQAHRALRGRQHRRGHVVRREEILQGNAAQQPLGSGADRLRSDRFANVAFE